MRKLLATRLVLLLILFASGARPLFAEDTNKPADLKPDRWIDPDGIPGALVICGGGRLPDAVMSGFRELAGDEAKLVVIPTASNKAGEEESEQKILMLWNERGFDDVTILHTRDRDVANQPEFSAALLDATAVWFGGGQQSRLADAYQGTLVEKRLEELLQRGGVIGGTSAGAAIQSQLMIASGNPEPKIRSGLSLLPDAVIDQHFSERNRQPRLKRALQLHPGRFGLGVDELTAVFVRGRRMRIIGEGKATILLPAGAGRDAARRVLEAGSYADLTSFRRAARDRQQPRFPAAQANAPVVEKGALMIVGGGGMPNELVDRFIQLAGGPEAKIVVVPTAVPDPLAPDFRLTSLFRRRGAKNVVVVRQRARKDVDGEAFRETLKDAGGVWFGGGRQWRFVDAYDGTQAVELFHDVLARGGVIGGSSAGASIQAEYMVRGNPLGNTDMMAWGYERGLNFLPGVAVDQHFTQRGRHADLEGVIEQHPQLLGIGIDETTAIIVQGSVAEVAGKNDVYFLSKHPDRAKLSKTKVSPGESYDLVERRPTKNEPEASTNE